MKTGTIMVYAHMDDDLIWMYPFWIETDQFINAVSPATPSYINIIHDQQKILDKHNIQYESNWYMPWGYMTDEEYTEYYWGNNQKYRYLSLNYLKPFWEGEEILINEVDRIKLKIESYVSSDDTKRIITHNNWGEYGHQHHIAVNMAVRELAVKYKKDVWMRESDNKMNIPLEINQRMMNFNNNKLYKDIRSIYQSYGRWTWNDGIPSGVHKFIQIVESGIDKTYLLMSR